MARPVKCRKVCMMPENIEFKPCNENNCTVVLKVEEFEAIRLIYYEGLTQEECALQMEIARTTVQNIYDSARKKIADIIVNGKILKIDGGNFEICNGAKKCNENNCPFKKI